MFKAVVRLLFFLLIAVRAENYFSDGRICGDVDARTVIEELHKLDGCRVVQGSVKILQIHQIPESFEDLSFPMLHEITGHLIVHEVSGLKSLSQLFPNLTRIHGFELFSNYSLIIVDNPDLKDVDFFNLKSIKKGAVRIERNLMLCYANSANWSKLQGNFSQNNVIQEVCHKCKTETCYMKEEPKSNCSCKGDSCTSQGTCCNTDCLSCHKDDANICTVCQDNLVGSFPHERCIHSCPFRTYELMNYRCITAEECRNLNINKPTTEPPYIPFQGACFEGCPEDFEIKFAIQGNSMSASCTPCMGKKCWRSCKSLKIDSTATAEKLKNCQIIQGHLEIKLTQTIGENSMKDLENSLSSIIDITDYLKVFLSPSVTSLSFLKNLQSILGNNLESDKYALVLWGNQNLQKIFSKEIQIAAGKILFHHNSLLCFSEIENFGKTELIENLDEAKVLNGDKATCNITNFEVIIANVTGSSAIVKWGKMEKPNSILDYALYYSEIFDEEHNVVKEGPGSCGDSKWHVEEIILDESREFQIYSLTGLNPFTKYAIYIKAYTSMSSKNYEESKIQFFSTLTGTPEEVKNFKAEPLSSSDILLKWQPPKRLNGEFEKYEVKTRKSENILTQRDYCKDSSEIISQEEKSLEEFENDDSSEFEQELKLLYSHSARKRSLSEKSETANDVIEIAEDNGEYLIKQLDHFTTYEISITACRKKVEGDVTTENNCGPEKRIFAKTLRNETADDIENFNVRVLPRSPKHYSVELNWSAPENPNGHVLNYLVRQTKLSEQSRAKLGEPSKYEIACIPVLDRENIHSHVINLPSPGNYSFQVSVTSFAGLGNFSSPIYVSIKSPSEVSLVASPPFLTLVFMTLASVVAVFIFTVYKRNQPTEIESRNLDDLRFDDRLH